MAPVDARPRVALSLSLPFRCGQGPSSVTPSRQIYASVERRSDADVGAIGVARRSTRWSSVRWRPAGGTVPVRGRSRPGRGRRREKRRQTAPAAASRGRGARLARLVPTTTPITIGGRRPGRSGVSGRRWSCVVDVALLAVGALVATLLAGRDTSDDGGESSASVVSTSPESGQQPPQERTSL